MGRPTSFPRGCERLRRVVAPDREERDPKVALALSGWICLQTSGMTDRINVDAPDALTDAAPIRRFARAHNAGSVAVARHPSGEVCRSATPPSSRLQARLKNRSERPIVLSVYLNPHFYLAQYELLDMVPPKRRQSLPPTQTEKSVRTAAAEPRGGSES